MELETVDNSGNTTQGICAQIMYPSDLNFKESMQFPPQRAAQFMVYEWTLGDQGAFYL